MLVLGCEGQARACVRLPAVPLGDEPCGVIPFLVRNAQGNAALGVTVIVIPPCILLHSRHLFLAGNLRPASKAALRVLRMLHDGEALPRVVYHRGLPNSREVGYCRLLDERSTIVQDLFNDHARHNCKDLDELREHFTHPVQEVQWRNLLQKSHAKTFDDLNNRVAHGALDQIVAQAEHGLDRREAERSENRYLLRPVHVTDAKIEVEKVAGLAHESDPTLLAAPIHADSAVIYTYGWCSGIRAAGRPIGEATDQDVNSHFNGVDDGVRHKSHLIACGRISIPQRIPDEARTIVGGRGNI
mmetsp:Transcript_25157/g.58316  ORF Transcript_25157/g.58316 Transcript_25157/m.58316 type:complete len:300 (-) Transcript_25157:163-1062(-)